MQDFTWSWLNYITKRNKKQQFIQNDIKRANIDLDMKRLGSLFAKEYNKNTKLPLLKPLLKMNKSNIVGMFIGIPLLVLQSALAPICIRAFQEYLTPMSFFDCDFSSYPTSSQILVQKSFVSGVQWVFKKLYPYWLVLGFGLALRSVADSICSVNCVQLGIKITASLLDVLFNKMMVLSETAKNLNAQGSLANILFSDTMKIQFFTKVFYCLFQVPLDLVVAIVYLATFIDPVSLLGVAALFIFVPNILICGKILSKSLSRLATLRDMRSNKIQEALNAIKVIKLFNNEQFQERRIQNNRIQELYLVKKACQAYAGHQTTGFTSYLMMSMLGFGALIAFNKFDISKTFTIIYLFTFVQSSISYLPIIFMALQDAQISLKRIQGFLQLSEVDQSFIEVTPNIKNAIEISGSHNFAYGLEEDQQISKDLDSAYYIKIDKIKQMNVNKLKLQKIFLSMQTKQTKIGIVRQHDSNVLELISSNIFDLNHSKCVEICGKYNLPAVTYFMNIKNYVDSIFKQSSNDKPEDYVAKQYLHMCVIEYNLQQWNKKDIPKQVIPVIKKLNLCVKKGELIGIKGPVGSGKSSIFSCILGEMKPTDTTTERKQSDEIIFDYFGKQLVSKNQNNIFIKLGGRIAYCPQNSPIFSSTIRENICFYKQYDEEKYNKIVDICCLLPDFEIFNAGDQTEVGGRGVTLSGGQRARISLARAIYNDADIYLLDDPLSAVDAHVGKRIWNEVVIQYLIGRNKTVLISSHQTQYFGDCTRVLTIENGQILNADEKVKLTEYQYTFQRIAETDEKQIDSSQMVQTNTKSQINKKSDDQKQLQIGKLTQLEQITKSNKKSIKEYITSGNYGMLIGSIVLLLIYQCTVQYANVLLTHWATDSYGWTAKEQHTIYPIYIEQMLSEASNKYGNDRFVHAKVLQCAQQHFNPGQTQISSYSKKYYYLYIGLIFVIVLSFIATILSFFNFSVSAAAKTYMNQLKGVMRTKLSFFDTTPQGRIINRLVKDSETVDFVLGRQLIQTLLYISMVAGMAISIVALSWACVVVIVPCIFVYLSLFSKFRTITPQIKRFESNTRSNVFSICQEVMDQLVSIRSYAVQNDFQIKFRELAQENINLQYHASGMSKWMSFRMTMIGAVMAFLIMFVAMLIAPLSPSMAQYASIIASYGYSIQTVMVSLIETITNTEQEMPAIERMVEYSHLENEEQLHKNRVQSNLIQQADNNQGLLIKNLVMRYRQELQPALKGVNVHINKNEHVAVVGRTGSGKSSLAITLFNLYQPENGSSVQLNNDQISHLPLYDARRKLAIIPQEPFLFSGTLRQQVCEFTRNKAEGLPITGLERIPDSQLWELLEMVQLSDYIKQQPGGLDCVVIGNGDNFSSGQRQLICVVRALLRDAEVVILDEATAYVDQKTDNIIQQIVKTHLRNKIVISIAHRLDAVLQMDKVLVMDQGQVAEFGTKEELFNIENGIFRELALKAKLDLGVKTE
ncbi:Xenobiotic-transporting_ATPase / Multidrug resistance-associated protein [Hexamita inflata]|uniref:Xenobiotic-transporting ATPase / Multidrug resistance-associated protein n=1 Tax=Hexamita inflata TaxID=28002 RepID=A0AA86QGD8_9EUKA|nr:Xenobiotic-transporting ATPase / Multidrug resistance-associated protein [Hexamita inflata]